MPIYDRRIVCITGGTGFRHVAKAFAQLYPNPTSVHVIGTADSGRSTRVLRSFFDMPAIGDLRSRCIDLADRRNPGYKEITDLLAFRLPEKGESCGLEKIFLSILDESHSLSKAAIAANNKFAQIILANLRRFDVARRDLEPTKGPFNFSEGSIGNFFLTGAYLDYGNIGSSVYLYEKLAGVRGLVLPASEQKMHLAAQMRNGNIIVGQHKITENADGTPIERLFYLEHEDVTSNVIHPQITDEAAEAIRDADTIVFSMGSFYTSILSSLHLLGMAEAVRKSHALKVFIPNTVQDPEILGMTTSDMVRRLVSTLNAQDVEAVAVNDYDYLQIIISNNQSPVVDLGGKRRSVQNDVDGLKGFKIERAPLIAEGPQKGYYQPAYLADLLARIGF